MALIAGGGVNCQGIGSPLIQGNPSQENFIYTGKGGGIFCNGESSSSFLYPQILDNLIYHNTAVTCGGGTTCDAWLRNVEIANKMIAWNTASGTCYDGGGGKRPNATQWTRASSSSEADGRLAIAESQTKTGGKTWLKAE